MDGRGMRISADMLRLVETDDYRLNVGPGEWMRGCLVREWADNGDPAFRAGAASFLADVRVNFRVADMLVMAREVGKRRRVKIPDKMALGTCMEWCKAHPLEYLHPLMWGTGTRIGGAYVLYGSEARTTAHAAYLLALYVQGIDVADDVQFACGVMGVDSEPRWRVDRRGAERVRQFRGPEAL